MILIFLLFGYLRGLQSEQEVLLTHGDSIDRVGSNLKVIAKSGDLVAGTVMPILIHAVKNLDLAMCNSLFLLKILLCSAFYRYWGRITQVIWSTVSPRSRSYREWCNNVEKFSLWGKHKLFTNNYWLYYINRQLGFKIA